MPSEYTKIKGNKLIFNKNIQSISEQLNNYFLHNDNDDIACIKEIYLPSELKRLGSYVFADCTGLSSISLPNTIEEIGEGICSKCVNLINIEILEDNEKYQTDNSGLYTKGKEQLI
jgi:hypothetical protein